MNEDSASTLPVPEIDEILAEVRLIKGREALSQNDWTEAIWHFSSALRASPSQIEFYTKLAEVLGGDADAWKRVHQLLINSIKTDKNNAKLRENLRELRFIRRRQREKAKSNGKSVGAISEIIEESAEAIAASAFAASEEIKNESRDFELIGAINEPKFEFDAIKGDLHQEVPGISIAEAPFVEDEILQADAKSAIGCYFSPGNAVFYVRLTDALEQDEEIEDLEADESGEVLISRRDGLYDEVVYEPAEEILNAPAVEHNWKLANIDLMLAEISFIDGKELLNKGDRGGAISHFREVIHYAPNSVEYYLKLVEALGEDPDTQEEAKNVLLEAIKIWPQNMDLRVTLYYLELGNSLNKDQSTKKDAELILLNGIKFVPDNAQIGDKLVSRRKIANRKNRKLRKRNRKLNKLNAAPQDIEAARQDITEKAAEPDVARILEELAELERKAAAELIKKARKRQLLSRRVSQKPFVPADKLLPQKISSKRRAALAAIVLVVLTGLGLVLTHHGKISPVMPLNDKTLEVQDLRFQWECNEQGMTYVVKVYDKGELVMCQFTKEKSYAPDRLQQSMFQAGEGYSWEVLAINNANKGFKYISEPQNFYISKPIEPQADPVVQSEEKPSKSAEIKSVPNRSRPQPKTLSASLPQKRID